MDQLPSVQGRPLPLVVELPKADGRRTDAQPSPFLVGGRSAGYLLASPALTSRAGLPGYVGQGAPGLRLGAQLLLLY
ncbi:hypothetical protein HPB50_024711 [Hyalomma asiaticum]|uniref:Uncharacterized protein n=1 Tax=Hyalomma asiaticum TaxID=266040 RepID=A0ACB7RRI2_HYAAI|nr:hypothetical protein HPB50_024711 [Hyalomma asiaticum]